MQPTVLIGIGGNALIRAGETATVGAERTHVAETCRAVADLVSDGWSVVMTHGNGPQVGAALLRSERAAGETYPLPLDLCVASTQGEIGVLLQQALGEAFDAKGIRRAVATVLTQVVVDVDDPGFARPTKPIGPFYSPAELDGRQAPGWTMVEEPPHGWRRVVASPEPREVVEEAVVRTLVRANVVVITLGGGGIPVVRRAHGLTGVEAVVDKDLASALLAVRLRVDRLVLATDVDRIYLDFGKPSACALDNATAEDLRRHAAAGHFPAGSMGPKVEAAIRFVEAAGGEAIVTSYDRLGPALQGRAGTCVRAR
ncbi:MAG: carbamate kinase [Betaproteobacteria bacterium]